MSSPTSSTRSLKFLAFLLAAVVLVYVALYPTLRRMSDEAARINHEVDRQTSPSNASSEPADLAQLRVVAEANPKDPNAHVQLAIRLRELRRLKEAEEAARTAALIRPEEAGPLLLLADIHHRAKHYDLAIGAFRAVLKRHPNHPVATSGLGWLYISLGWNREALELLTQAVRAHPEDVHLKAGLSLAYLQATDLKRAEKILLGIKASYPDRADLWSPLVDVYLKARQFKEARAIALEALRFEPKDVKLLSGLGQSYYDESDYARAAEAFERVISLDPDHLFAHHRLGLSYKGLGRTQDAIRELEYVYSRAPDFEQTSFLLGQLYVRTDRVAEGQKLLKAYQAAQPAAQRLLRAGYLLASREPNAAAHFRLAMGYRDMNDKPKMIVELYRTVDLDPDHKAAQKLLREALDERSRVEPAP